MVGMSFRQLFPVVRAGTDGDRIDAGVMGRLYIEDRVAHHYSRFSLNLFHAGKKDVWMRLVMERWICALNVSKEGG